MCTANGLSMFGATRSDADYYFIRWGTVRKDEIPYLIHTIILLNVHYRQWVRFLVPIPNINFARGSPNHIILLLVNGRPFFLFFLFFFYCTYIILYILNEYKWNIFFYTKIFFKQIHIISFLSYAIKLSSV